MRRCSVSLLLLIGCAGTISLPLFDEAPVVGRYPVLSDVLVRAERYAPPPPKDQWISTETQPVQIGTHVKIDIAGRPEFSKVYPVSPDGILDLPRIGEVVAIGQSLKQLRDELADRYARFISNPRIQISIREETQKARIQEGRITFSGEVQKPGDLEFKIALPLRFALQLAGGVTYDACLTQILIVRPASQNRPPRVIACNLLRAIEENDATQNIALAPDDLVVVPRNYPEDQAIASEWEWIEAFVTQKIDRSELVRRLGGK